MNFLSFRFIEVLGSDLIFRVCKSNFCRIILYRVVILDEAETAKAARAKGLNHRDFDDGAATELRLDFSFSLTRHDLAATCLILVGICHVISKL